MISDCLRGVCHDGRRIQSDEGRVYNTELVKFLHQSGHDVFQIAVLDPFEKSVIGPIRRPRPYDIEFAVMSEESVVFQVIREICDLAEARAFHYDKCAEHSFLWKTSASCIGAGKLEIEHTKQLAIYLTTLWDVNKLTS